MVPRMKAGRRCPAKGCPRILTGGERYCREHARETERRRGTRQQRGYGADHDRERARVAPAVEQGHIPCSRCGVTIRPGEPWDLGHSEDRTTWTGPEHASCNRSDGGKRGAKAARDRR